MQRRIWLIAWKLWEHRNKYLHETRKSIHPQDVRNIHQEIEYEYSKGLDTLPNMYQTLFQEPLSQLLERTPSQKLTWIYTIWSARETLNPAYFIEQLPASAQSAIRFKYVHWKAQT